MIYLVALCLIFPSLILFHFLLFFFFNFLYTFLWTHYFSIISTRFNFIALSFISKFGSSRGFSKRILINYSLLFSCLYFNSCIFITTNFIYLHYLYLYLWLSAQTLRAYRISSKLRIYRLELFLFYIFISLHLSLSLSLLFLSLSSLSPLPLINFILLFTMNYILFYVLFNISFLLFSSSNVYFSLIYALRYNYFIFGFIFRLIYTMINLFIYNFIFILFFFSFNNLSIISNYLFSYMLIINLIYSFNYYSWLKIIFIQIHSLALMQSIYSQLSWSLIFISTHLSFPLHSLYYSQFISYLILLFYFFRYSFSSFLLYLFYSIIICIDLNYNFINSNLFLFNYSVIEREIIVRYSLISIILLFSSSFIYIILSFFYSFHIISTNLLSSSFLFSSTSSLLLVLVFYISSSVIIVTIDYLSIMESIICLLFIFLFIISMLLFLCFNSILSLFIGWDWLGIISYFCINYWSSKIRSGIKAVIYNKIGDCLFLSIIIIIYSFNFFSACSFNSSSIIISSLSFLLSFFYNYAFNIYSNQYNLVAMNIHLFYFFNSIILFFFFSSLFIIMFSKSAQYPFFSWLLNAMLAPTPISSLLHSSTMVIAGVYLGLVFDSLIFFLLNYCSFIFNFIVLLLIYSLIWSLFKGISLSDMKSIIAYSTISQISYMFLCLLLIPHYVLYHIVVHGLFKSLIFLISGSLIHVQLNFQSVYMIRSSSVIIKVAFILSSSILILSLSKEGIIHYSLYNFSSSFIYIMLIIGGLLTCFYSIGFFSYVFIAFNFGLYYDYLYYSSFIFFLYALSVIFCGQCFEGGFAMSSIYSVIVGDLECLFSIYSLNFYGFSSNLPIYSYLLIILLFFLFYSLFIISFSLNDAVFTWNSFNQLLINSNYSFFKLLSFIYLFIFNHVLFNLLRWRFISIILYFRVYICLAISFIYYSLSLLFIFDWFYLNTLICSYLLLSCIYYLSFYIIPNSAFPLLIMSLLVYHLSSSLFILSYYFIFSSFYNSLLYSSIWFYRIILFYIYFSFSLISACSALFSSISLIFILSSSIFFCFAYCFDSRSSFLWSWYYYVLFSFSYFIGVPLIHCVELFVSFKSYSLFNLVYYHFSLLCWIIILFLLIIIFF